MIETGKKAPAFTLRNQDDEKWALTDAIGRWVVVYFYPKADTPGCTTEACDFTDSIKDFTGMNATVVGISPDSVAALKKFQDKYKLKVTLLSDPDKKVLEKYGAWGTKKLYGKETVGVIRSTVLIDPAGKVAHHWPNVKAKGHAAKVREALAAMQE
ncbi:MAG: thioredoxin-dependent thiol peroxidase [Candidatus Eisenbacteria bacterium]